MADATREQVQVGKIPRGHILKRRGVSFELVVESILGNSRRCRHDDPPMAIAARLFAHRSFPSTQPRRT